MAGAFCTGEGGAHDTGGGAVLAALHVLASCPPPFVLGRLPRPPFLLEISIHTHTQCHGAAYIFKKRQEREQQLELVTCWWCFPCCACLPFAPPCQARSMCRSPRLSPDSYIHKATHSPTHPLTNPPPSHTHTHTNKQIPYTHPS